MGCDDFLAGMLLIGRLEGKVKKRVRKHILSVLYCIYLVNIFDYRRTKDMLSNDANILKIKHEILYQVAKLTYAGQL